jgi:hypothetical protein
MRRVCLALVLALTVPALVPPLPCHSAPQLQLYGTFHAMGVVVQLSCGDDPDGDATAQVTYRVAGQGEPYRSGHPLSRVSSERFVGSLFWLEPSTSYDVRVTFSDADGALDGAVVQSTATTRGEITVPPPSESHYVSATGSGTDCTVASPCALVVGLGRAEAGDEVVLRGGVYHEGGLSLSRSGQDGRPIVIRAYDGETPILDGGDPATFTWTHQGGGVYRTTVNVADPHLVTADGERLYPYGSLSDLQGLTWGIAGFYAAGATVYVRLAGDADPNAAEMIVSRHNHAIQVEQDFIYFLGLTFQHYGQGDWAKAIYLNNASDNLIRGCTFGVNDLGIGIKRESHRNVIEDNEFYDTIFDWPWDAVKGGSGLETGGVVFYDPATGRGNVIRGNTFHDFFDGLNVCPSSTAGLTNETDVYENLVYRAGDDGMETDGRCSNVRIWNNTFHDVLMGISLAPVYTGPVYAIRNVIYRTGVGNNEYTGSPFKFNSGYDTSGPMYLFHNTADAALPGNNGLYVKAPGTWVGIVARNNVWSGTAYAVHNYNTAQPIDLDYDDLWNGESGDLVRWDGTRYATLGAFAAGTGQEAHGVSVDPGFVDPGMGDYSLDPGSELIDSGVLIPGINDYYVGAAPDIGAFEYPGYGFSLAGYPKTRAVEYGGVATYSVVVEPLGSFTSTVSLMAESPVPTLTLSVEPSAISPPGEATLTITDTDPGPPPEAGIWYAVPITGTGGGITQTTSVRLLVGGERRYLPLGMGAGS